MQTAQPAEQREQEDQLVRKAAPVFATQPVVGLPQAGWYDDGENSTMLRYWDGQAWTEHRSAKTPPGTVATKTNAKAIWSLVLGLVSLLVWPTAIPGVILGFMARNEITQRPGESGAGIALAGIICGFVFGIIGLLIMFSYLGGGQGGY